MKSMLALIVVAATMTTARAEVLSEPFGIRMGEKLSDLDYTAAGSSDGFYQLKSVPKPHRLIRSYMVKASPNVGVCAIFGTLGPAPTADLDKAATQMVGEIAEIIDVPLHVNSVPTSRHKEVWTWVTDLPSMGRCSHHPTNAEIISCMQADGKRLETPVSWVALSKDRARDGVASATLSISFKNSKGCSDDSPPKAAR